MKRLSAMFLVTVLAFSSASLTAGGAYSQSHPPQEQNPRKAQDKMKHNKAALAAKRRELCREMPKLCRRSHESSSSPKPAPKIPQ